MGHPKKPNFDNLRTKDQSASWENIDRCIIASDSVLTKNCTPQSLAMCSTKAARSLIEVKWARSLNVLPLTIQKSASSYDLLTLVVPREFNAQRLSALKFKLGVELKFVVAASETLALAINCAYRSDGEELAQASLQLSKADEQQAVIQNQSMPFFEASGEAAKFLMSLVEYGIARNASDIHIIPRIEGTIVRMRVNGELFTYDKVVCSSARHMEIINRLKVLAALDTTEKFIPQDGAFSVPLGGITVNIRVNLISTIHGQKAALRIIGAGNTRELNSLGLSEKSMSVLLAAISKQQGLIMCAGATGSGKTTLLYALLIELSKRELNIVSIEDPVEAQISGIVQTLVDEARGVSYSNSLRALLRHDPDVIMIGEVRDTESAQIACQAALTGHLVMTATHAANLEEILLRLQMFNITSEELSSLDPVLISCKLIPCLCKTCNVVDLRSSARFKTDVYRSVGCAVCDYSGYHGRVPVLEIGGIGERQEIYYTVRAKDELMRLLINGQIDCKNWSA